MKRIWAILQLASVASAADVTATVVEEFVIPNPVRVFAMDKATKMFAGIGVSLEWAKSGKTSPPKDSLAIEVKLTGGVAGHPGAMAFSNPFDPVLSVTVMYDRIDNATETNPRIRGILLAHVLAHEIGHLLKANAAHSAEGVMKAYWSQHDYGSMLHRTLPFAPGDADEIRQGLAWRRRMYPAQFGIDGAKPESPDRHYAVACNGAACL